MRIKCIPAVVAALLLFATSARPGDFRADKELSSIRFLAAYLIFTNIRGRFREFSGFWRINAKTGVLEDLRGTVKTKSVDTNSKSRDKRLRAAEFFDAENSDRISFVMTKYVGDGTKGTLTVKVTIRGVTKEMKLAARLYEVEKNGRRRHGLTLSGTLDRFDFDVGKSYSTAVIGRDVTVSLQLAGGAVE